MTTHRDATKIAVHGAGGRMGRRLLALAHEEKCEVVLALDIAPGREGSIEITTNRSRLASCGASCVVDFSLPEGTSALLPFVRSAKIPLVVGTTGLADATRVALDEAAEEIPLLVSTNMSRGVNLLFALAKQAARVLSENYEIEIVEAHHKKKLDSPSGTAKTLSDVMGGGIPTHSIRAGSIVGDHTALFAGEGEVLELTHRAGSRDIFARGALAAARFLAGKPPGRYEMKDVLGL